MLPVLHIFSGIFMVLLVLKQGIRLAVIEGAAAAVLMILVYLVAGAPVMQVVVAILTTWPPAILLARCVVSVGCIRLYFEITKVAIFSIVIYICPPL